MTTKQQVERLHTAGLTVREIANNLNLSTQIVYRHHTNLGLTPNRKPTQAA